MCKQSYSTTTMDLVLSLCAANVVAPSMLQMTYNLSKRKKRFDRVLCASSEPPLKRSSSAGTAIILFAHLLMARIIGITVLFAFSRVMSMTGGREIG